LVAQGRLSSCSCRTSASQRTPALLRQDIAAAVETDPTVWRDLQHVLDEEINRLAHRHRAPFVLCYLEGKTTDEAARQLGWPRGTVATRLAGARKRLRTALTQRGITLGGGLLGASLTGGSEAQSVPPGWIDVVLRVLRPVGGALRERGMSSAAKALSDEVVRTMVVASWKHTAELFLAMAALAIVSVGVGAHWSSPAARSDTLATPALANNHAQEQPDDPVQYAIARARMYLISLEKDGKWDQYYPQTTNVFPGGMTSLVVAALLESGSKPAEPPAAQALAYLRSIDPDATYVLGLQTVVFCRAEPKKDLVRIQRNVDRLLAARCRDTQGRLTGWTYHDKVQDADNSNTQFAVLALDAAERAGAKVGKQVWDEVRDYYMRTQQADGGWAYRGGVPDGPSTVTMTYAGTCGLVLAQQRLQNQKAESVKAVDRATGFVGKQFRVDSPFNTFYALYGLSRTGRLAGKRTFGDAANGVRDWYQEGSDFLVRKQAGDGSWRTPLLRSDDKGVIDTSFALLFLAGGNVISTGDR
jgi:Sigma-70, region 4